MRSPALWPLFFVLLSCASKPIVIPPPAHPVAGLKTPVLILPTDADDNMKEAAKVFGHYANSDEFYQYARREIDGLEGGNVTNVDEAIRNFRACLHTRDPINVVYYNYSDKERGIVLGGWADTYLAQNRYKDLDVVERAGHFIHEISHACGFTHIHNDVTAYPIIKRSWPYQIGRTFKEFLSSKAI